MQVVITKLQALWSEALDIWFAGGWAMIAIAVIALAMFAMGLHIWFQLRATGFRSVREETWRRWVDHPLEREGRVGKMLDLVTSGRTLEESSNYFEQLRVTETLPFERDLKVMKICVSAAPLVGLLGTVTAMLATFGALSSGSGGDKTMSMIAEGISEALITTETGLVIALPGLFFQYQLDRGFEAYKSFLARLETACHQSFHRRTGRERRQLAKRDAQRTARTRVANELHRRWRAGVQRQAIGAARQADATEHPTEGADVPSFS